MLVNVLLCGLRMIAEQTNRLVLAPFSITCFSDGLLIEEQRVMAFYFSVSAKVNLVFLMLCDIYIFFNMSYFAFLLENKIKIITIIRVRAS